MRIIGTRWRTILTYGMPLSNYLLDKTRKIYGLPDKSKKVRGFTRARRQKMASSKLEIHVQAISEG